MNDKKNSVLLIIEFQIESIPNEDSRTFFQSSRGTNNDCFLNKNNFILWHRDHDGLNSR